MSRTPEMEAALKAIFGDSPVDAWEGQRCINPPMGCGKPVTVFRDPISAREYSISGMCQKCQDEFFGVDR